jgi:hypothetical protein
MFIERRRLRRHVIDRTAQYYSGLGALPRTCIVTDISEGGARLYNETDMPDTFSLSVQIEGKETRRECRVVWRLGGEFGIRFTDRGGRY